MEDEIHYPLGAEPEKPAEEPKKEAPEGDEPKPNGDDAKPEPGKEETPEAKPEEEPKPEEPIKKEKRSIYDDLKDKKHELKTEQELRKAAEARNAELEGLLAAKDEAKTPSEKKEAAKDIQEFAEKHGYEPAQIEELTSILTARLPKADTVLTPEEAQQWREERAKAARDAEDRAILDTAPSVKTQLHIQDDAELQTVMKEVVKLAHTAEFHDKEVEYIIWKKKDELSKLVSPKKPSFEQGGQKGEAQPDVEPDFSKGGVTPEQASKVMFPKRGATMEVRPSK